MTTTDLRVCTRFPGQTCTAMTLSRQEARLLATMKSQTGAHSQCQHLLRVLGLSSHDFHDDAKLDLEDTGRLADEGREVIGRVDEMSGQIDDPRLDLARQKAENAAGIDSFLVPDEESVQEAYNDLYEARKILSGIRKDHAREVNLMDLENCMEYFSRHAAEYATQSESAAFNNLARTARRYASDSGFERYLNELWRKTYSILYRQDWFVMGLFRDSVKNPKDYRDEGKFAALKARGMKCIDDGDIDSLRGVVQELFGLMKSAPSDDSRLRVNIIRA